MNNDVMLGMSGGIDSTVAAILLLEQGFNVTGLTLLLSQPDIHSANSTKTAKEVCSVLGIRHLIVDLRNEFDEKVIRYFRNSYQLGETPFPCAVCNPGLKFAALLEYANQYNCHYISTGHYATIIEDEGFRFTGTGIDPAKDQSFFLWGLRYEIIERLIFPLGSKYKSEVKQIALDKSFEHLAQKKESTGVCFLNGTNYRDFILKSETESKPGLFVDTEGNVLGEHKGIIRYTVGQRRGLDLQLNRRFFVSEIQHEKNLVVLADYDRLYRTKIYLKGVRFAGTKWMDKNKIYKVRIRYRMQENRCKIMFHEEHKAVIDLLEPVAMVAPGQVAVVYDGNRVLGGGYIEFSE